MHAIKEKTRKKLTVSRRRSSSSSSLPSPLCTVRWFSPNAYCIEDFSERFELSGRDSRRCQKHTHTAQTICFCYCVRLLWRRSHKKCSHCIHPNWNGFEGRVVQIHTLYTFCLHEFLRFSAILLCSQHSREYV